MTAAQRGQGLGPAPVEGGHGEVGMGWEKRKVKSMRYNGKRSGIADLNWRNTRSHNTHTHQLYPQHSWHAWQHTLMYTFSHKRTYIHSLTTDWGGACHPHSYIRGTLPPVFSLLEARVWRSHLPLVVFKCEERKSLKNHRYITNPVLLPLLLPMVWQMKYCLFHRQRGRLF